jgi:hypothetical protein
MCCSLLPSVPEMQTYLVQRHVFAAERVWIEHSTVGEMSATRLRTSWPWRQDKQRMMQAKHLLYVWLSNAKMIMVVTGRLSGYDFDKRRSFDLTCVR